MPYRVSPAYLLGREPTGMSRDHSLEVKLQPGPDLRQSCLSRSHARSSPLAKLVFARQDFDVERHAVHTPMPAKHADSAVMTSVRAASLAGFEDLVRAQGGDPAAILRACGLVPEDLADPERDLPSHAVALVREEAACVLGVHDFGLRLCAQQGVDNHHLGVREFECACGAAQV